MIGECQDEVLKTAVSKYLREHGQQLKKLQFERQCLLSEAGLSALSEFHNSYHDVRCERSIIINLILCHVH